MDHATATDSGDTRTRLVEATAALIWSGSFQAAGVDEICRRADVRKGSFYHFFASKKELAIEAIRTSWARVRESVFEPIFQGERSGLDRLQALVETVDRTQRDALAAGGVYLGCPFGSLGQEMAHQDAGLREVTDEIFEGHVDYFERALREAVDAGEAEPGDLRGRARVLFALMEGGLLVAKVGNRPEHFTEAVRLLPVLARG